jgi:hypothetical protein
MPSNDNKERVNKLFDEYLNEISSDENADEYLKSEGFNPSDLINEGIRKIKQLKMKMASSKTENAYSALATSVMDKANEEVQKLMELADFDFAAFVKKKGVVGAFRNLEKLSQDEKREFLEKYILLKLQKEKDNDQKTH